MTKHDLQGFFDDSPSPNIEFVGVCHDCKCPVTVMASMAADGKVTIEGGALYFPQTGPTQDDKRIFFKCDACFEQNSILKDYQPCDIYSRVVGYLTPTNGWNEGKQAEFKLRNTFTID